MFYYVCIVCFLCYNLTILCMTTGHIGIAVPDVYAACKLFEEQGVKFVKKPDDGKTCPTD